MGELWFVYCEYLENTDSTIAAPHHIQEKYLNTQYDYIAQCHIACEDTIVLNSQKLRFWDNPVDSSHLNNPSVYHATVIKKDHRYDDIISTDIESF